MSFFCINYIDNVATALTVNDAGVNVLLGETDSNSIISSEKINDGHKVALIDIKCGEGIIKYGVCIGSATRDIEKGEWVHLHNMKSNFDERSKTLDINTGVSTDIAYE